MRAIWTGSISFGLVHIPVRLLSASKDKRLSFRLLSRDDHTPISLKKMSDDHVEKEMSRDDIVKGYEYKKGQYVVLEEADFKKANPHKTQLIEIVQFVDEHEIDPKLYEKPYYIEPLQSNARAYVLLRDALKKSSKVAIAKYVIRDREHIGALRAEGSVLMLDQMRFAEELYSHKDISVPPKADYTRQEFDLSLSLIDDLTKEFRASEFKDTFTREIMKVIEEKAKGLEKKEAEREMISATDVADILSMLKKSLRHERERDKERDRERPRVRSASRTY